MGSNFLKIEANENPLLYADLDQAKQYQKILPDCGLFWDKEDQLIAFSELVTLDKYLQEVKQYRKVTVRCGMAGGG